MRADPTPNPLVTTIETAGAIADCTVKVRRRLATADDVHAIGPFAPGTFVVTASVVKGARVADFATFRDRAVPEALAIANAVVAAFSALAAIGAETTT